MFVIKGLIMITEVKEIENGVFFINNTIKINNIKCNEHGFKYDLDYDKKLLTKKEATDLLEELLIKSIQSLKLATPV
jgi:hypothetical protein